MTENTKERPSRPAVSEVDRLLVKIERNHPDKYSQQVAAEARKARRD